MSEHRVVLAYLGRRIADAGVTANTITGAGLTLCATGAVLLATGASLWLAIPVILSGALLDFLDGPVARCWAEREDRHDRLALGRFYDSLADRLVELAIFLAAAQRLAVSNHPGVARCALVLYGLSSLASYVSVWCNLTGAAPRLPTTNRGHRLLALTFGFFAAVYGYSLVAYAILTIASLATVATVLIRLVAVVRSQN